jgi:hypothetical protein
MHLHGVVDARTYAADEAPRGMLVEWLHLVDGSGAGRVSRNACQGLLE